MTGDTAPQSQSLAYRHKQDICSEVPDNATQLWCASGRIMREVDVLILQIVDDDKHFESMKSYQTRCDLDAEKCEQLENKHRSAAVKTHSYTAHERESCNQGSHRKPKETVAYNLQLDRSIKCQL